MKQNKFNLSDDEQVTHEPDMERQIDIAKAQNEPLEITFSATPTTIGQFSTLINALVSGQYAKGCDVFYQYLGDFVSMYNSVVRGTEKALLARGDDITIIERNTGGDDDAGPERDTTNPEGASNNE